MFPHLSAFCFHKLHFLWFLLSRVRVAEFPFSNFHWYDEVNIMLDGWLLSSLSKLRSWLRTVLFANIPSVNGRKYEICDPESLEEVLSDVKGR